MRLLVTCLQGNFLFEKIVEIIHIYKERQEGIDELFQSMFVKTVSLPKEINIEEKWSESCE